MSIIINNPVENQIKLIEKYLTILPKKTFFDIKRNYNTDTEDNNDQVFFYINDENNLYIPYKFGIKLLGYNPNLMKGFPLLTFKFNIPLFDTQIDLYNKAYKELIISNTLNFCIYTGSGKTVMVTKMTADLSNDPNGLTLILVTNRVLLTQWESSYKKNTNGIPYVIKDSNWNPPNNFHIIICTTGLTKYIPNEYKKLIGILVIDEAHTFCSSSRVFALLCCQPKYVITCTATPYREDGMYMMIDALTGDNRIVKISEKPFNVYRINTGYSNEIPTDYKGSPDWNLLVNQLCEDEERNNLIIKLIKDNYINNKILVLTARSQHAIDLTKKIGLLGIKTDYMTGSKKSYFDSDVLVGTTKKIGTGFDEESACKNFNGIRISLLILVISIKSLTLVEQVAGRVFRSQFPQILYLVDDNSISIKHFKKGTNWFLSRNGALFEIDTPKSQKNKIVSSNDQMAYNAAIKAFGI